jgi:hypothetical protein
MDKLLRSFTRRAGPALFILVLAAWQLPASATCAYYSGRATALRANANVLKSNTRVVVADTGEIDPLGATRDATVVDFQNPPPTQVGAQVFRSIAGGFDGVSAASAATEKLSINTSRLKVTADLITADSQAVCHPDSMTVSTSGTAQIVNLRVNGIAISPTAQPNVKRQIGNITIITNEQTHPDVNTIHVNAVHIIIPTVLGVAGSEIIISHVESGILTCPCI